MMLLNFKKLKIKMEDRKEKRSIEKLSLFGPIHFLVKIDKKRK